MKPSEPFGFPPNKLQIKPLFHRPERTIHPQRPAPTIRPGRGARELEPFAIGLERLRGIDHPVAGAIPGMRFFDANFLVPAVHAADGIRMHREGDVLKHAAVAPKNTRESGSTALVGENIVRAIHGLSCGRRKTTRKLPFRCSKTGGGKP